MRQERQYVKSYSEKKNLNKNTKRIHLKFTCVNILELYSAKYNIASQTPALQAADWASP